MQRRTLLKLGLVSGAVLALAGGAAMLLQPGLVQGRLSDAGRGLFISAGRAILQGTLPQDAGAQQQALQGMADRVDALAQNLPPHVQAELSQLVGLLCTSAGRRGLAGREHDSSADRRGGTAKRAGSICKRDPQTQPGTEVLR